MGYITRAYGTIAITPPIPYSRLKDSPFLPDGDDQLDVKLVVVQHERDTSEGVLTVVEATGVVQRWEDDVRNYNIVEHLQELINAFPDHEFTGRFDMEGEETGDLWRLKVVRRRAVRFLPELTWPAASE